MRRDMPPPPAAAAAGAIEQQAAQLLHGAVQLAAAPQPGSAKSKAALAVFKAGVRQPRRIDIGGRAVTVLGRNSQKSHIVLDDAASVSRQHAAFCHDASKGGQLVVADLGSANGTYVEGVRLPPKVPKRVRNGDKIRFGESVLVYVVTIPMDDAESGEEDCADDRVGGAGGGLPMAFGKPSKSSVETDIGSGSAGQGADSDQERRRREAAEIAVLTEEMKGAPSRSKPSGKAEASAKDASGSHWKGQGADGHSHAATTNGGPSSPGDESSDVEEEEEAEQEEEMTEAELERARVERVVQRLGLPISHEVALTGHSKPVTALAMDPAGGRVATGSTDYKVRLFDFGGMDRRHRAFREIEPQEGHVVVALSFSGTGDRFLCCTGSTQPKIFDRDAAPVITFVRGDVYLKDTTKTKGHIARVTGGEWHPLNRHTVMTTSLDGTARVWDLNGPTTFDTLICRDTLRLKNARGLKAACTAGCWGPSGLTLLSGDEEGSFHLHDLRQKHKQPLVARFAHDRGSALTALCLQPEGTGTGHTVGSRGLDSCVRIWDLRKLPPSSSSTPATAARVHSFDDVPTHLDTAGLTFSPDGRVVCAGTNVRPNDESASGTLLFFDLTMSEGTPQASTTIGSAGESVVRVLWHPKLKQIAASSTAGVCKVLYDLKLSTPGKGALLSAQRTHRARDAASLFLSATEVLPSASQIITPHALPMFRDESMNRKRKAEKDRRDPVKTKRPQPPMGGPGVQGRLTESKSQFTNFLFEQGLIHKSTGIHGTDSREVLLKYAKDAEENPEFFSGAYGTGAAAKPKLMEKSLEEEEEEFVQKQRDLLDK